MKKKKLLKETTNIIRGATLLGLGSQALGRIGGTSATHGQQSLTEISKQMPLITKIKATSMTTKALERYNKMKKKGRKKN